MTVAFQLPDLPYARDALGPFLSEETLEFHHGKHHATYVKKLNDLIEGTEYAKMELEDIIKKAEGGVFNNAAQTFNHTFFWNCMTPNGGGKPSGAIADAIEKSFGSFDKFKEEFSSQAASLFGSGWLWLVKDKGGKLKLVQKSNAGTPLTDGETPVLTLDVWEHAYYIDYRNARPKFIEGYWDVINWDFANKQLG
jgi:Fe-Mn family superoxide dismutase